MFAGGVQDAGVDLSLEGGDNLVDLDLLSTPDGDEGLDLDLGQTASCPTAEATGENTAIEFDLGDGSMSLHARPRRSPARQAAARSKCRRSRLPSSETPTVETPALKSRQAARDRMQPATDRCHRRDGDRRPRPRPRQPRQPAGHRRCHRDRGRRRTTRSRRSRSAVAATRDHDRTAVLEDDDGTALMPAGDDERDRVLPKVDFGEIDLDVGERRGCRTPPRRPAIR